MKGFATIPLLGNSLVHGSISQVTLFAKISEWFTHGGPSFVVWRSRYIDDFLQECRKTGTTQVVILGAGTEFEGVS